MPVHGTDYPAIIQFFALAACIESFPAYTLADLAHIAAICEFHPVGTATHAIYGRRSDLRGIVHYTPLLGGLFPQPVVIADSGYAGVAAFAIESATCDQFFHSRITIFPAPCPRDLLHCFHVSLQDYGRAHFIHKPFVAALHLGYPAVDYRPLG